MNSNYKMVALPDNWDEIQKESERYAVDEATVRQVLARVPPSWTLTEKSDDGAFFVRGSLQVIVSVARELDDQVWVHVSVTQRHGTKGHRFSLPDWETFKRVKNDFLGDAWAYQVLPPADEHVNLQEVLHLFSRLDGQPALPDFTHGMKSI